MRNLIIGLAAAGTALAVATPATAQYYQQPYGYNGYGNNGYGYNNGNGQARGLQNRVFNVLRSLNGVRPGARERIRDQAINIDRQLRYASRNGLNPYEARNFDYRIGQLERQLQRANYNRGYGYNNGYNNGYAYDRDRDGRDDRYEDDQGYRHDR
jgi:hypothetical protein